MKFEVSHQDRSVIIALGSKLKNKQGEGLVTPPIPLPDERVFAHSSKEELAALARMAIIQANEVTKANEILQTKLGLIISLLDGTADVRCEQSTVADLDLFAEDQQITGQDGDRPLLESDTAEGKDKKAIRNTKKDLTGCTHVVERVYALTEEQIRMLEDSGMQVRVLGEDVSEFYQSINVMIRFKAKMLKYSLRDKVTGEESIVTAKSVARFLPKTKVGDLFLGDFFHKKYAMHVPFNRYSQALRLDGCNISRQDLDRYHMQVYERIWKMEELLEEKARASEVLYIDEVPTVTQKSPKKKNYIWVFNTDEFAWYRYFEGRAGADPLGHFKDYSGFCMTDAYAAYPAYLHAATLCACLVHCRRRYVDYRKITGSEAAVKFPLDCFGKIYHEDGILRDRLKAGEMTEEQFLEDRNAICLPILKDLKQWCDNCALTGYGRSVPLKRAVTYTLNNWEKIENTFLSAKTDLDNNRSERLVKVIKLGSKNWITHGSEEGARATALMYSLIETAKMYGLNPRDYLSYLFMKGAVSASWGLGREILEPLMPWNVNQEDLSIVTGEYQFIADNMIPIEKYEARMAEIQAQKG
ncbi:MAG TPA: IS66 family transposase [Sphaerochaeta sp.]|nr:IS66 family transposase [Sphaerochaeta sp.]